MLLIGSTRDSCQNLRSNPYPPPRKVTNASRRGDFVPIKQVPSEPGRILKGAEPGKPSVGK